MMDICLGSYFIFIILKLPIKISKLIIYKMMYKINELIITIYLKKLSQGKI